MTTKTKAPAAAILTVLAMTLALLGFGTASPASAAGPEASQAATRAAGDNRLPVRYYGSIALSPDQAAGWSYDYRTKAAAKRAALRSCKARSDYPQHCRSMGWVANGCMAAAIKTRSDGWVTAWASGYARTKAGAKRAALRRLPGSGGRIRAWVCTTR